MPARDEYNGLGLVAIRDEDQGVFRFGVELEGAFFTLAVAKIGDVDEHADRAREAAEAARHAQAASASSSSGTPATTEPGQGGGTAGDGGELEPGATGPTPEQ